MLRGSSQAKLDAKGRIKIPTFFRKHIEEKYGRDCFVTSTDGEYVRVYPMPVLLELEKKLNGLPSMTPSVERFKNHLSYYGQQTAMDDQGRILIHPLLRKSSGIKADVQVVGKLNWIDIWDREKLESRLKAEPLTDEDNRILASHGI